MAHLPTIPRSTRDANLAWEAKKASFAAVASAAKFGVPVKAVNHIAAQQGVSVAQIARGNLAPPVTHPPKAKV